MARKATKSIPLATLKTECKKLNINSWPEYQKRFKEISGAKKTLHATYAGQWKGNKIFFDNAATVAPKVDSKKVAAKKTASNAAKKTGQKKATKPAVKKVVAKKAAVKKTAVTAK